MKFSLISKLSLVAVGFCSYSIYAHEYYKIEGSHEVIIPIKASTMEANGEFDLDRLTGVKRIQLLTIVPTEAFREKNRKALAQMEADGGEQDYSKGIQPFTNSATSVDLGMGKVPVLDQGAYGTCVTFASTAALDAKLKLGDYIDQQCSLALNKFLGNDVWDGAYTAVEILQPLKEHGIIPKGQCFGSTYPKRSQKVSVAKYESRSDKSYTGQITYHYTEKADLNVVKATLKAGYRVTIGTGLLDDSGDPISVNGFDVTIKGSNKSYDGGLWACKQPGNSTNYCSDQKAGHEIVIFGYDDKQQLLKIRNSWGKTAGEDGNYYMTYAFFNAMVGDHTELK
ncbi:C1 family peptidase [Pigmentibacter sp. JX0631]|uniref:C1 family peptidase n=1 Tax=Pigmentibacter sp. JX0631 TaxID=2976982 RepID=UPI00246982D5|nr:C1 family peptidase [Pigmentibacter sp. JX0631]WGL59169.1 C1 family peptidase [Pigmentibacter sp. JX0631]